MINQVKKHLETSFTNIDRKTIIDSLCAQVNVVLTCAAAIDQLWFDDFVESIGHVVDTCKSDILAYESKEETKE